MEIAGEANISLNAAAFATRLRDDRSLAETTTHRVAQARQAMQALPSGGVPQLLVKSGGKTQVIAGQPLYDGAQQLLALIAALA